MGRCAEDTDPAFQALLTGPSVEKLLDYLSEQLPIEFGKGFTVCNLRAMRQFYYLFPIRHTLCAELYIFNLFHTVERIELVLLSAFDACSG